jgi:hypothetical protein
MDTDSEAWERAGPPEGQSQKRTGTAGGGGVIESAERLGKN